MIATILAFLAPVGRFLKPYAGYLLIAALVGLALWWSNHQGYMAGVKAKEAEYAKALEKAQKKVAETTKASDAITAKAKGELALSLAKIDELSNQLHKEAKTYVSPKADRACTIPAGYVLLRNAAGTGSAPVPPSAGQSFDSDSGVALSALAENDIENGRSFQTAIAEITAWRAWYVRQADLWEKNYGAQR